MRPQGGSCAGQGLGEQGSRPTACAEVVNQASEQTHLGESHLGPILGPFH